MDSTNQQQEQMATSTQTMQYPRWSTYQFTWQEFVQLVLFLDQHSIDYCVNRQVEKRDLPLLPDNVSSSSSSKRICA